MAKDPAMLWYWSDWHSGTSLMSRFLKGCYMDLLHAQFNHGHLSLEEIKACLGSDFGASWPAIQKKFKPDEKGGFFNERLEDEQKKRAAFTESRRSNRAKKADKKTYDTSYDEHMSKHMIHHMENENINNTSPSILKGGTEENFLWTEVERQFKNDFRWIEQFCRDKDVRLADMTIMMEEFLTDRNLSEDYKTLKELKGHFLNKYNKQKKDGINYRNTQQPKGGKSAGANQLLDSLRADLSG